MPVACSVTRPVKVAVERSKADPLTGLDESGDTAEILVVGGGHITRSRRIHRAAVECSVNWLSPHRRRWLQVLQVARIGWDRWVKRVDHGTFR
jgi:hypothetical protein